jgi:hypothetical protein
MNFELSAQELSVLISSMQYMTRQQEAQTASPEVVSRLYNKLHSHHEHLERLNRSYTHDA